jgi:tetratricopeptide (TPR) repeat protein
LACLARPEIILGCPIALLAIVMVSGPIKKRILLAGTFLIAFCLMLVPTMIHNARQGDWVLIAYSGGENFYIANQPEKGGGLSILNTRAIDMTTQQELSRKIAEEKAGRSLRPSEVSSYWRNRAIQEFFADPMRWFRQVIQKIRIIFHPGDPTDVYSLPLERSHYLKFLYVLPLSAWSLLGVGIIGLVLALRYRARESWPLMALVGIRLAVLLAFSVQTRLRLPLLFFLAPFGGYAIVKGWQLWKLEKKRLLVGIIAILLIAISIAGIALTKIRPRSVVRLAAILSMQERLDEALEVLQPILDDPVPYGLGYDKAGWINQKRGNYPEARKWYDKALEAGLSDERRAGTLTRLGVVLEELGEMEEAGKKHDAAVASSFANAGTYYERAIFRLRTSNLEGAVEDLRKAIQLDPNWPQPRSLLERIEKNK